VGLFGDSSMTSLELAAKFGVPMEECHIFDISSDGNYSHTVKIKRSQAMQVPLIPFSAANSDMKVLSEIGVDAD
jgi:hypothetical protein